MALCGAVNVERCLVSIMRRQTLCGGTCVRQIFGAVMTLCATLASPVCKADFDAFQLYLQGDLEKACEMYKERAEQSPDATAEFYLGRIEERRGHLDAALQRWKRAWSLHFEGLPDTPYRLTLKLIYLSNFFDVYATQGKLTLAAQADAQAVEIVNRLLDDTTTSTTTQPEGNRHTALTPWMREVICDTRANHAQMLQWLGRFGEATNELQIAVAEASQPKNNRALGWTLAPRAELLAFFERYDEAIDLLQRRRELPFDAQYAYSGYLDAIRYAFNVAQRDGSDSRVYELIDEALAHLQEPVHERKLLHGQLLKAELLMQDNRLDDAWALLQTVSETAHVRKFQDYLAWALKGMARNRLAAGDANAAEIYLTESLMLYRALGRKNAEPELYELRARCFADQGQPAKALQTWEDAYRLCETLNLHFRSLRMRLGIAELQLRLGNKAELARAWERIDKFVAAHPNLPEPTQLRLQLARLDYLQFGADKKTLVAAYEEAKAFVKASKLSKYQARALAAYDLQAIPAVVAVKAQRQPTVDLQPIVTTTRVSTGELAHARFALTNPTTQNARGTVRLASRGGFRYAWTPTDQGWLVRLDTEFGETNGVKELILPSGTATAIYLEAEPASFGATNTVAIIWQADTTAEVTWAFSAMADPRTVAIVDASLAANNPFYAVPLYHELYYRGQTQKRSNIRVKTSEPCRVELLDATRNTLLAIDANGDGDFFDAGDMLYEDADINGFPDLLLSPERDVANFELLVYPASNSDSHPREIEISVFLQDGTSWTAEAVDVLSIR